MKYSYRAFLFILSAIAVNNMSAQQNNLDVDYSEYQAEAREYYMAQPKIPHMTLSLEIIKMVRAAMDKPVNTVLVPTQQEIDGPYGKIGLRIFKPEKIDAVYLDIHGGGHIWGSAMADDSLNDVMAQRCRLAVVSVDYHLAPEYPFPAQIYDCNAAVKWLLANAEAEFGTDKIFIGGGSAGAQLAATTAIYVRDSLNAASKILGVGLQQGLFDLGLTPSHRQASDETWGLNKWLLSEVLRHICGTMTMEERQNPFCSPLYADLQNLPPAFFLIGTADALLDDTYFMEARWRSAGNKTYLAVFPEVAHGFNILHLKMADLANELYFNWINERIAQSE
ncbi:MAG: alpha/beta hydrolase [Bacteroidia bacterium]|nr:MAG: alpha/beta hydrolase [Bacteroidia bacterium]